MVQLLIEFLITIVVLCAVAAIGIIIICLANTHYLSHHK